MTRDEENPVNTATACQVMNIGKVKMSAIKNAMGLTGCRHLFLSDIRRWLRDNPDFRESHVYARSKSVRPGNRQGPQPEASGTPGE